MFTFHKGDCEGSQANLVRMLKNLLVMEQFFYCKDMDDCATVVDVYDSAALIGKDFEYLIEQYGVEAVTDLMPKVIRVLEQLEYLASKNERENEVILQMESTITRLNLEKEERNKERQIYEKVYFTQTITQN